MVTPINDLWIDGVSASSLGIRLQGPLELSALQPKVEVVSVPGKDGELVFPDGSFNNREGTVAAYVYSHELVQKSMTEIYQWLFGSLGYRKIVTSGDPDHFLNARIVNAGEIIDRINRLAPFTIRLSCEPRRYLHDEGNEIQLVGDQRIRQTVLNPCQTDVFPLFKIHYTNPLPLFESNGAFVGAMYIDGLDMFVIMGLNGQPLQQANGGYFYYDAALRIAYSPPEFSQYEKYFSFRMSETPIKLSPGEHEIYFNGVLKVPGLEATLVSNFPKIEISPRWYEL